MLLKDLLWLSRIESIEHSDKTTSVDMCDLTVELVEDLRAAWPDRPITLRHEFNGLVLGDPMELHSAVSNLVVNALKYSAPASEVVIEWVLQEGRPTLSIIDKGEGIDPVHIPRLTERFHGSIRVVVRRPVELDLALRLSNTWHCPTTPSCNESKLGEVLFRWF